MGSFTVKKNKIHHITSLMFLIMMAFLVRAKPINIVTNDNNPPFSFTLADNSITGLYVEFWQLWSQYSGHPIEITLTSFQQSLHDVRDHGAVHSGVFSSPSRSQWANFSSPIHRVETGILYNRNYQTSTQLKMLRNITVAVQEGSFQETFLKQNYPHHTLVPYSDPKKVFTQLINQKVDALVAEKPFINAQLAKLELNGVLIQSNETLITNHVYAMVSKDNPDLLNTINQGIEAIPIEEIIELEKKWLPALKPYFQNNHMIPFLSIEENKWLLQHKNLTVGYDHLWYPIEFSNNDGQFNGIAADYIQLLNELLGIDFTPINSDHWSDTFDSLG